MLDFGWAELLVVIAVAVFVVGPQDIPKIMYSLGRILRRVQYIRYAVSQQFDDLMNAGDIEELRKGVNFETARKESDVVTEKQQDEEEGKEDDSPTN
ncbi:MAG: twin-arginine translocase TatA/TatE family subunit [Alphaproteobacteria bacterium]|nr:twin-arginine translocase TatA/TatE family subunit [Alphaproteobacteria bacterium]